jgi:hypothetical protein
LFKPIGNGVEARRYVITEWALARTTSELFLTTSGFSKNLEKGRMVLPDRLRRSHSRAHAPGVLPLFMVVMKHILTGLQHGSPKRDAP